MKNSNLNDEFTGNVAVIMTTYNGEHFLQEQIDSILNQEDYPKIQLFVRDDGSNDSTEKILCRNQESDSRIHLIRDQLGNLGVKMAFFALLHHVQEFDWVFFSDQDDVWPRNKVKRYFKFLFPQFTIQVQHPDD
ncbi:glycosyltransferase [Lacticaseibacillus paracasei]|uniref:glycosyltransferase n=1 Tax=Lacticaseibacillus paracasei TaxID=1597 RepID=UPI0025A288FC|nr:glycosyltransferase [Lacticaseibacillus paracasei]MDM7542661.1 glycosyltransferase [Lacticaseibacillus paracasei]